jgi:hypothetical protein
LRSEKSDLRFPPAQSTGIGHMAAPHSGFTWFEQIPEIAKAHNKTIT